MLKTPDTWVGFKQAARFLSPSCLGTHSCLTSPRETRNLPSGEAISKGSAPKDSSTKDN